MKANRKLIKQVNGMKFDGARWLPSSLVRSWCVCVWVHAFVRLCKYCCFNEWIVMNAWCVLKNTFNYTLSVVLVLSPNRQYTIWTLFWVGWNIFLICFYLNVGGLNRVSGNIIFIIIKWPLAIVLEMLSDRMNCETNTYTSDFFASCLRSSYDVNISGQWYSKFRHRFDIMVWSQWLWLCTNIFDKYYIGRSIPNGAARISWRMLSGVSNHWSHTFWRSTVFCGKLHLHLTFTIRSRWNEFSIWMAYNWNAVRSFDMHDKHRCNYFVCLFVCLMFVRINTWDYFNIDKFNGTCGFVHFADSWTDRSVVLSSSVFWRWWSM